MPADEGGEKQEKRKMRKIMFWNVAGMNEVDRARELMEENDIVILVETWVTEEKTKAAQRNLSEKFEWKAKSAKKEKQRGRAKGGQLIGIKKEIKKEWSTREWEYGMIIENRQEAGESLITVYNNVGMKKIEMELRNQIEECMNRREKIMIIGDLNARIGEENNEEDEDGVKRRKRRSKDKVINSEGRKLLKMCDELGLCIWNGRAKNDEEGEITFVGGDEECLGSVLDLVITVERGGDDKMEIEVKERIESDHLPVVAKYKIGDEEVEKS